MIHLYTDKSEIQNPCSVGKFELTPVLLYMFYGKVLYCRIYIIGNFCWCTGVWDIGTSIDVTSKTNKTSEAYVVCRISNACMYIVCFCFTIVAELFTTTVSLYFLRFLTIKYVLWNYGLLLYKKIFLFVILKNKNYLSASLTSWQWVFFGRYGAWLLCQTQTWNESRTLTSIIRFNTGICI